MGIGLSTYKYYEKSERDIPAIVLLSLTQYGVNPVWLFTGDGDMVSTATNATIDFVDASHAELITRFKQKELAKEINRLMVEIERIDPEELSDLKDYLEFKLLKKTGERPEGWNGKERRNTGR